MSPYKVLLQKVTKHKWVVLVKRLVIALPLLLLLFLLLNWCFPLPDKIEYSTVVFDAKGEMIHAFLTKDEKWRMKTDLEEISPLLRRTIMAKEDKYFYYHPGVNVVAVVRAGIGNLLHRNVSSGASTITMQVARALERRPRTLAAKVVESFRAFQLEWKYSKDEILQLYLNLVPYGGNIEGVKTASLLYFKKNPDHLSLAEITALSIIPNRPSSLVVGRHNGLLVQERNRWLRRFAAGKVFTPKEIEDALQEPLTAQRGSVPRLVPHLARQLKLEGKGPFISTYIQTNTQLKVEKLTRDYVRTLKLKGINNAAVVVVDNATHQVITYIGSADFADTTDGGQVNGVVAVRQPGSTLKPLLFGLCMDEGLVTPKTVMTDVPVNYGGYAPENYDQQFNGYVTVEEALEHSLNIPAVKALNLLGKERMIATLVAADFTQIRKDQRKLGLSLVLGGCGTTLEQLTGLFAAFANEGVYTPLRLTPQGGKSKNVELLSPAASYCLTEILSKVARPDFPLNWQATEHMPKIAWKTGTSYGRRDAWSIGYNRRFTVGVWVGNFSGTGVAELSGANTATPLLFKIFNTIDYNNDGSWFQPTGDLDERQVCSETGLVPGPFCTDLVLDHFIPLVSSTQTCHHVQEVKVSADSMVSYCETCAPAEGYIKKLYQVIGAEMQEYFSMRNQPFPKVPTHNPGCEKVFNGGGPVITSPAGGSEYYLDKKDPEPVQLKAQTAGDVQKVYWYINDQFYKAAGASERLFFVPQEGAVKISCTDDKGRNRDLRIYVKYVDL